MFRRRSVIDLVLILAVLAFFAVAWLYVRAWEGPEENSSSRPERDSARRP
jgi:hypothetical protein